MNIRRFAARTSREAMARVREAFGDDAIVLHTQPCDEGVEVVAMSPDDVQSVAQASARAPRVSFAPSRDEPAADTALAAPKQTSGHTIRSASSSPSLSSKAISSASTSAATRPARAEVQGDVDLLSMTTLSFQDYVRQRMNKRRRSNGDSLFAPSSVAPEVAPTPEPVRPAVAKAAKAAAIAVPAAVPAPAPAPAMRREPPRAKASRPDPSWLEPVRIEPTLAPLQAPMRAPLLAPAPMLAPVSAAFVANAVAPLSAVPALPLVASLSASSVVPGASQAQPPAAPPNKEVVPAPLRTPTQAVHSAAPHQDSSTREQEALMRELRSMKGMIEERFGALSFMDGLQRDPRRAQLAQRLLDAGFSMGMIKALSSRLPATVTDEAPWVALALERQLRTATLEEEGGVYALVGPTGVGKTSCVAKIAAAFVARHGALQLGLVTLDAQRPGGHDSLRAQGRTLGVPVHVAHDRASLEDLLHLLSSKKLVLIDTAGIAPRGAAAADLLHTVGGPGIQRLLVVAATAQGETIEDCVGAFGMSSLHGVLLTKLDEAVRLGPALDVLIRHHIKLYGTAHGQRLAEDWHRADARRLLQRALRAQPASAWRADSTQLGMLFKTTHDEARPDRDAATPSARMPLEVSEQVAQQVAQHVAQAVERDALHLVPRDVSTTRAVPNLGPRAAAFLAQAR